MCIRDRAKRVFALCFYAKIKGGTAEVRLSSLFNYGDDKAVFLLFIILYLNFCVYSKML